MSIGCGFYVGWVWVDIELPMGYPQHALAMSTSKSLEGSHTYSHVFMDLRVAEALEGHGEHHFFELIRDVMTDHGREGGRHKRVEEEKVRTNSAMW
jgi:hypothetical protein